MLPSSIGTNVEETANIENNLNLLYNIYRVIQRLQIYYTGVFLIMNNQELLQKMKAYIGFDRIFKVWTKTAEQGEQRIFEIINNNFKKIKYKNENFIINSKNIKLINKK